MLRPPIWFTTHCYHSDRYHRELHFTGSPIKVLVSNGPDTPTVPYFVQASVLCRFSSWFRANFQQYQQQQAQAQASDQVQVPSPSSTFWQECTLYIPNCDPEVFELYLNWQYTERFPIPVTLPRNDEDEDDEDEHEDDNDEKTEKDYFEDALLFLAKAYVLGRRVHDEYFSGEIVRIMRKIMNQIENRFAGLEHGMDAFERASSIVNEHGEFGSF